MSDGRALARPPERRPRAADPCELDVWSDIACPFCHVAHVRIARAAAGLGRPVGRPQPSVRAAARAPPEGVDPAAFSADRFGGTAGAAAAFAHVRAFAADDGVTFDFAGMRAPNTRMAQRAIALVEEARGTDAAAASFGALSRPLRGGARRRGPRGRCGPRRGRRRGPDRPQRRARGGRRRVARRRAIRPRPSGSASRVCPSPRRSSLRSRARSRSRCSPSSSAARAPEGPPQPEVSHGGASARRAERTASPATSGRRGERRRRGPRCRRAPTRPDTRPSRPRRPRRTRPRSRPGTSPATVRADSVMPVPGTKVTVAVTSSRVGGVPAPARPCESAIEKHDACAAAINSSGLVRPSGASAREAHVTPSGPKAPLPTLVISPVPVMSAPCQVAAAVRRVAMSSSPCRRLLWRSLPRLARTRQAEPRASR